MIISLLRSSQCHLKTAYLAPCLQHHAKKKESVLASMCTDGANKRKTRGLWVRSQLAWEGPVPFVTSHGVATWFSTDLLIGGFSKQQTHIVREHYKRSFEQNINIYIFAPPAGNFLNLPSGNKKVQGSYLNSVYYTSSCKNYTEVEGSQEETFASFKGPEFE